MRILIIILVTIIQHRFGQHPAVSSSSRYARSRYKKVRKVKGVPDDEAIGEMERLDTPQPQMDFIFYIWLWKATEKYPQNSEWQQWVEIVGAVLARLYHHHVLPIFLTHHQWVAQWSLLPSWWRWSSGGAGFLLLTSQLSSASSTFGIFKRIGERGKQITVDHTWG